MALDITPRQNRSSLPLSPKGMGTSQDWYLRPVPSRFTVTGWMGVQSPIRIQPHAFSPMVPAEIYALHRDLLPLRRIDPGFRSQRPGGMDGAVLGPESFVLRFFGAQSDDRLLVVNLGSDLHLAPAPEPLLAPPEGMDWTILWSSEDPRYGGDGVIPLEDEDNWHLPGHTATVLRPHTRQGQEG